MTEKQANSKNYLRRYTLVSAVLAWLGSVNVIVIGVYSTINSLSLSGLAETFIVKAYAAFAVSVLSAFMLGFGGYLMLKRYQLRKGGVLNLSAGILTIILYYYFYVKLSLLNSFGTAGYFLCIPATLSGLLGLIKK